MFATSSATSERSVLIDKVIAQRKPLADRVALTVATLDSFRNAVSSIETTRNKILQELRASTGPVGAAIAQMEALPFARIGSEVDESISNLRRLLARLDRSTLNIGIVGYARQGKSRALQAISGLDDSAIPTSDAGHCTGAKSLIVHQPGGAARGQVWFYGEQEFLEQIIWPYYSLLNLGLPPLTLRDFATAALRPTVPIIDAGRKSYLAKLLEYQAELPHYQSLIGASPRQIDAESIRSYVAYSSSPMSGKLPEKYYNHRAVRDLTIFCEFRHADVGKVGLLDLPGLGDHNIKDGDLLRRTLGHEVDFVVFLKKPNAMGDFVGTNDTEVYDLAQRAIPELPIADWSAYVLNHVSAGVNRADNSTQCALCSEQISQKNINVLKTFIIDCSSSEAVCTDLLGWILEYLSSHIAELDGSYVSKAQATLRDRVTSWISIIEGARGVLGRAPEASEAGDIVTFNRLFDQLWDDLANSLGHLLKRFRDTRDQSDNTIANAVHDVVKRCEEEDILPGVPQIETRANIDGGFPNAFYSYLNTLRAHLTDQFLNVDSECQRFLEDAKSQVTAVLLTEGKLNTIFDSHGTEMLNDLKHSIEISGIDLAGSLYRGVHALSEAQLSYRGFIQHRIRLSVDRLTPDTVVKYDSTVPTTARLVEFQLEKQYSLAMHDISSAVESWTQEPNQVAFALVEEFIDRVLRATGAKEQWRDYYAGERGRVWATELSALNEQSRIRKEWNHALSTASQLLSSSGLTFTTIQH